MVNVVTIPQRYRKNSISEVDLDSLLNRPTADCGKCHSFQSGCVVYCDNKTDVWRCHKCGYMWKAPCNFDEDYS